MNKDSKILKEELDRMNKLAGLFNEQEAAPAAPAAQAIPAASARPAAIARPAKQAVQTAADTQKRDQVISNSIDDTMDTAMNVFVSSLSNILSNATKSIGDKDGVLDAPGVYDNSSTEQKPVQESIIGELTFDENKFKEGFGLNEGGLLGLAVSAPAILKYGGQASGWLGKKMNSQWLQKWGNKTAEAGEKLHHKYIGVIEPIVAKFMPNASKEQVHKAANAIFIGGVAVLFTGGLTSPDLLAGGLDGTTLVKGKELAHVAIKSIPAIINKLGFA